MVALDGARCDFGNFGSLSAFLGVPVSSQNEVRRPGPEALTALLVPSSKAKEGPKTSAADSTLLKKKVAFRMLKQLGCEVRCSPESDISFIEVSLAKQPVLFKMLVELGHGPCRSEGEMVVRVKEQRPRKPEEVVAALAAPKVPKTENSPEEGYPSIGRPRLRPEDEERLVKRLYVPNMPKSKSVAPEKDSLGPKQRRTAAEQRAYLERLVKPSKGVTEDVKDGGLQSNWSSCSGSQLAWPKFSDPARPKPKGRRKFSLGAGSPALVQAGQLLLGESPVEPELLEESDESDREEDRQEGDIGCFGGSLDSLDAGPTDPPLSPSSSHASHVSDGEKCEESTEEWLNRLLGPLDSPSNKSKPSFNWERLEELAKPRQLKERSGADLPAAPCRSPRSQREACARLSQPRKPKEVQETTGDEEETTDDCEEERPVHVIPSMLAQLAQNSPRLERIDEEGSEAGARRGGGGRTRARVVAAPYSVPVCPKKGPVSKKMPGQGTRSSGIQTTGQKKVVDAELTPEELGKLANFLDPDDSAQSVAMLDDIDALYSRLISGTETAECSAGVETRPVNGLESAETFSQASHPNVHAKGPDVLHDPETPVAAEANLDGEDLLHAVDQLLHQMTPKSTKMESAEARHRAVSSAEPNMAESRSKEPGPEQSEVSQREGHGSSPEVPETSTVLPKTKNHPESELPMLLEEILWSALLLVRAGQSASQVVSALPLPQIRDSCCLSPLPSSLQQRLADELPDLAALCAKSSPSTPSPFEVTEVLPCLRRARDALLGFAKARSETKDAKDAKDAELSKLPRPASATRRRKVRRTGMSYWTEESLEQLQAPKDKDRTPKPQPG